MSEKPQISGDVKNQFHLVNRAAKALREAGREDAILDMKERALNENTKFTLDEVKTIVSDYVELI